MKDFFDEEDDDILSLFEDDKTDPLAPKEPRRSVRAVVGGWAGSVSKYFSDYLDRKAAKQREKIEAEVAAYRAKREAERYRSQQIKEIIASGYKKKRKIKRSDYFPNIEINFDANNDKSFDKAMRELDAALEKMDRRLNNIADDIHIDDANYSVTMYRNGKPLSVNVENARKEILDAVKSQTAQPRKRKRPRTK